MGLSWGIEDKDQWDNSEFDTSHEFSKFNSNRIQASIDNGHDMWYEQKSKVIEMEIDFMKNKWDSEKKDQIFGGEVLLVFLISTCY